MNNENNTKLTIPEFGELSLHDILVFYDMPLVFVSKDIFNTFYLFQETIQNENQTEWLVIKITQKRYWELKYNTISLQEAFKRIEHGKYYLVSDYSNSEPTITSYDYLPEGKITDYNCFVGEKDNWKSIYTD